jgi:hypothetical protein
MIQRKRISTVISMFMKYQIDLLILKVSTKPHEIKVLLTILQNIHNTIRNYTYQTYKLYIKKSNMKKNYVSDIRYSEKMK